MTERGGEKRFRFEGDTNWGRFGMNRFFPLLRFLLSWPRSFGMHDCTEVMSDQEQLLLKIFHLERSSTGGTNHDETK